MLYYAYRPLEGYALELAVSGFYPPPEVVGVDAYVAYLRALYWERPALFVDLAKRAMGEDLTLLASARPELLPAWHAAVCGVARARGWEIHGGERS